MDQLLNHLKNPLIAALVAGVIVMIFKYIDDNMNQRENTFSTNPFEWMKPVVFTSLLVGFFIYITQNKNNYENNYIDENNIKNNIMTSPF